MMDNGTESEKHLGRRLRILLRSDAQDQVQIPWAEEPSRAVAPYEVKLIGSDKVFLVRDSTGEVLEVEVRGNIDPGAWED